MSDLYLFFAHVNFCVTAMNMYYLFKRKKVTPHQPTKLKSIYRNE